MLYPALPPTPPPIIATLTQPQSVNTANTAATIKIAANSANNQSPQKSNNQESANQQPVACRPAPVATSNLVSNLLGKFLVNSYAGDNNCQAANPASNNQVASNQIASNQTRSAELKNQLKSASKQTTGQSADISAATSNSQPQTSQAIAAANSSGTGENSLVGNILAKVQDLVAVSLYASLNPALNDASSQTSTQANQANPNQANQNPENTRVARANTGNNLGDNQDFSNQQNPNPQNLNPQNPNNPNTTIAANPNIDSSRIIAIVQGLINASISASISDRIDYKVNFNQDKLNRDKSDLVASSQNPVSPTAKAPSQPEVESELKPAEQPQTLAAVGNNASNLAPNSGTNNNSPNNSAPNNPATTNNSGNPAPAIQLAKAPGEPFLVAVTLNGREVGTLDIIQEGKLLLIPLEAFVEIAGISAEKSPTGYTLQTPLGEVKLEQASLRQMNGVTYISGDDLAGKLRVGLELNTGDLTLAADLPWRGGGQQGRKLELKPEFFAPNNGLTSLRQELNITRVSDRTRYRSSTQLGGRLAGGSWRMRLNNNFVNQPDITEYFFYQRSGRFRFQVGRQQVGLHPLINSIDLTGLQLGYTNLPAESFGGSYGANELLPRRSRPIQTFTGEAPPASIAQLRVGGIAVAQQIVGFDGKYEFVDVNLPIGQNNEIEVAIFDRSNLSVPMMVRSQRINASDLLLPAGGNVQLGGLGFSGNLVQNTFFDSSNSNFDNQFVGFYQLRQGLSSNLTFEGSLQAAPSAFQSQAGLIWRLANPVVLSASMGSSDDKLGYTAELDVQLERLEISANSQSLPEGFSRNRGREEKFNHSLEVLYRPSNRFNIGFIARRFKDEITESSYILPTFTARPFSSLSLSGRPDIEGRYLLNAFYQPNWRTRLAFSSFAGIYNSNLTYRLNNNYELSFGNEFGDDTSGRYEVSFGRNPSNFRSLAWNLGVALRDGEVAPLASASMQVLPGLITRLEYQGIPSRSRGLFGGFGDDRFTISLVSDLSFARGRVTPATYSGINKERGAIAGRLKLADSSKNIDLSGSRVRVVNDRNRVVGSATTDRSGNFFVGSLPEGVYTVELEPDELPVEVSTPKTSYVVQVANSAATKLDFPLRIEFGLAGRITDVAEQPIGQVRIELINKEGARVISGTTDEYGLYRLDGVPVGKYTLQIARDENFNPNENLPKRPVEITNEFVYNQNLKLPVSAASLKQKSGN